MGPRSLAAEHARRRDRPADRRSAAARPRLRHDEDRHRAAAGRLPDLARVSSHTVTGGDGELQAYLQRMAGYCLTGVTTEHALFFLYGTGANGKSVFANTLTAILGDYATVAPMDMFMATHGDRHPTDMAGLRGARIVTSIETEQGSRWAESKLKALTGGDKITARFMRQDFFEFIPQFKLLVVGNHKPSIRNVDEAMRRRLHMVPFTVTIPPAQARQAPAGAAARRARRHPRLGARGLPRMAAHWACARRAAVMAATEEYFEAEDAIGRWIDECCDAAPRTWRRHLRAVRQLEGLGRGERRVRRLDQALLGNPDRRGVSSVTTPAPRGFLGHQPSTTATI